MLRLFVRRYAEKLRKMVPGKWMFLEKARKKSALFKRCSVRRAATDTPVAPPKGEPLAAYGQRVLPQGFHLISLLRRQLPLKEKPMAAQGQARPLYNLSGSPCSPAPLVGEPLAKRFPRSAKGNLQGFPPRQSLPY